MVSIHILNLKGKEKKLTNSKFINFENNLLTSGPPYILFEYNQKNSLFNS